MWAYRPENRQTGVAGWQAGQVGQAGQVVLPGRTCRQADNARTLLGAKLTI